MKFLITICVNLYFVLNAIGQEDWRLYPKDSVVNTFVEDTLKKQLDFNKEKGFVKIFKRGPYNITFIHTCTAVHSCTVQHT